MTILEKKPLLEENRSNFKITLQRLTLEWMVMSFFLSISISNFLETNLLLEKARTSSGFVRSEADSEVTVADLNTWKLTVLVVVPILVSTYVGPLTDRYGSYRILFLYVPIIGHLLNDVMNCVHVYNWNWPASMAAVTESILPAITGSKNCFSMLCICHVSRLSKPSERTAKIGILNCIIASSMGIGYSASGYLLTYFGFLNGFALCILLNILAITSGLAFIKPIPELVDDEDLYTDGGLNMISCVDIVRKKRSAHKQFILVIALITFPLLNAAPLGEGSVFYLYLRYKFQWSTIEYSAYTLCHTIAALIVTLSCVELLSHRLKVRDTVIGVIGSSLDFVCSILRSIVVSSWQMYAVSFIGTFHLIILSTVTSVGSKCVESYEYGKLNALFNLVEGFTPVVYPIYNQIYRSTITTMPNAFFLVSVLILAPTVILFSIMHFVCRLNEKEMKHLHHGKADIAKG